MLDALGTFVAYVVAIGLVGAPFWWLAAMWRRRCVAAATRAAAELDGRYEPAGSRRFSGGTIYGRKDGRDVSSTSSPAIPRSPRGRRPPWRP